MRSRSHEVISIEVKICIAITSIMQTAHAHIMRSMHCLKIELGGQGGNASRLLSELTNGKRI